VIPAKACYVAAMPTWVIIAALATIGITGLLTGVLYRINAPTLKQRGDDGGAAPGLAEDAADRNNDAGGGGADGGD
jgi:hypothetical protein